jgi:hypothetical protein
MALLDIHPGRRLSGALLALLEIHPASLLGGRAERRRMEEFNDRLSRMPAHLLDDIGVSGDGKPLPEKDLDRIGSMTAAMRT